MKNNRPWVGDKVRDAENDRVGVITDVRSGVYVLRAVCGPSQWTKPDDKLLTVITPCGEDPA
ncbi:hypothetical protein OG338_05530 [Streptomyces sp. NBC_00726]|uniref:hypothetical protein n=1 Tax=Streptomyces sp. NBC_00726 TaxID=2903674 RepID=UPI0038673829